NQHNRVRREIFFSDALHISGGDGGDFLRPFGIRENVPGGGQRSLKSAFAWPLASGRPFAAREGFGGFEFSRRKRRIAQTVRFVEQRVFHHIDVLGFTLREKY